MNASTASALNRINSRFYARYVESFSATRSHPWPGWRRAIAPFLAQGADDSRTFARTILDVGCGNGRFALFLDSLSRGPYRYLGIDSSTEMMRLAGQRVAGLGSVDAGFERRDLAGAGTELDLGDRTFDLVVLFGVLHHIPGLDRRRQLLAALATHLAPAGVLILSFWQFGREQRFGRRILDWSEHNRLSPDTVDVGQLERGDYLLAWGTGEPAHRAGDDSLGARRYCHYADSGEAGALIGSLGLATLDRFESDGRTGDLNLYFVLQASA